MTEDVDHTLLLHKINRRLRKFGIVPSQQGRFPFFDSLKVQSAACGRSIKQLLRPS